MPIALTDGGSETTVNWPVVFLIVTAVGVGVLALAVFDVAPVAGISNLVLAALIVVAYALVSILYWLDVS
ncbi:MULTISPECIES: hypothetical protein [Halorussus]|uniref:hypothetical protein n=1 Tax=Halorussus TaxID=1070314 RepID=UPI0020A1087A|nr:hypothetical protein [Halorussus vallis]USZ76941.1 hypothetical protein NGM07_06325 [Halorussus vallis]